MKSTSLSPAFVRHTLAAAAMAVGSLCASSAMALTIAETETNDPTGSGVTMSFANADLIGSGSHTITGSTNPNQDVDLFRFDVTAGLFTAVLVSMNQTSIDDYQTHFTLFNSSLQGVDFDIDAVDGDPGLGIDISATLAAGTYYLAVAGLQNHPVCNVSGTCSVYNFLESQSVHHWNNNGQGTGDYAINVTSVPETDTYAMLLAGLGLVGFAVRRRQTNPV